MDLEFTPPSGTDKLPIGKARREDRNHILNGIAYVTPLNEPENDMYESEGLILGFDAHDELEFVEVIPPSTCHFFRSILLGRTAHEVLEDIQRHGHIPQFEDDSYNFKDLGIILYCPGKVIGSASVYPKGYYD